MPDSLSANNRIYTIVKDFQSSYQLLVSGLVRDALTGEALTGMTISLQSTNIVAVDQAIQALLFIKVLRGGLFCLAGTPERIFPDLANTDYTFDLRVRAPSYTDLIHTVTIPKRSTFPLSASVQIDMARPPVRIQGRVLQMTATPAPIVGARVMLLDEPNPPTSLTTHIVALRTPLAFAHATATTVQQRQLTPTGSPKQLTASVTKGQPILLLNDVTGLATGDLLLIDTDATGEYAVIASVSPTIAGQVTLSTMLNSHFAAGAVVQKYIPGAAGTSMTLSLAAQVGDGMLFLPASLSTASTDPLEIADATTTLTEYHALGALTNNDGYYRLDGFSRVQTIYMHATAAGYAVMTDPKAWTIDYGQPVNTVDFQLLPLAHP